MKKQILCLCLALIFIIAICSGCSRSNSEPGYDDYAINQSAVYKGSSNSVSNRYEEKEFYDLAYTVTTTNLNASKTEENIEKKVIKNAELTIQAEDVNDTYAKILDFAIANGGYEFNRVSSTSGDRNYINAVIKIPPESLDKLLAFADTQGEISRSEVSSEDITAVYYDAATRLNTLRRSLDKYYEFLEESQSVDDMLRIQKEINLLTLEIESFEGKLRMWDKLIAESTVDIYISQKVTFIDPPREIKWSTLSADDMGYLLKKGFLGMINTIATFIQWIVIIIASASPVIIIAAVIIIIFYFRNKKKRTLKMESPDKKESEIK